MNKTPLMIGVVLALAAIPAAFVNAAHDCPAEPTHTYGFGSSVGFESKTATTGDNSLGFVTVQETNTADCNGDGTPADYDGDWETGVGGAFFGYGPYAQDPVCNYDLQVHVGTVSVNDIVFGNDIWFKIGADDTGGPAYEVDPVDGSISCSVDGSITPGDPTTDPTADADDCLTAPQNAAKGIVIPACGAGGDGGYWVFLNGAYALEDGALTVGNPATAGTITAA